MLVLTLTVCAALTKWPEDNECVEPDMEEEAEDEESSGPVLDARSELMEVAACAILPDDETVDSDEAEAEAVSAATEEADGLRITSMDCDFSNRLSVWSTKGALLAMLVLLLLLLLKLPPSEARPRRLLSVLRLREACNTGECYIAILNRKCNNRYLPS